MILLLDTSGSVCKLSFIDGDWRYDDEWQSNRELANQLLQYIDDKLTSNGKEWSDISAIGAFEGPGSFTGLRIGLTVLNTIAYAKQIPIVGARGDNWQDKTIARLDKGEDDKIVLPFYGVEANITLPTK